MAEKVFLEKSLGNYLFCFQSNDDVEYLFIKNQNNNNPKVFCYEK